MASKSSIEFSQKEKEYQSKIEQLERDKADLLAALERTQDDTPADGSAARSIASVTSDDSILSNTTADSDLSERTSREVNDDDQALNIFENLPPNLTDMRRRLFLLEESPITMSALDFERYWSFVDNIWIRNKAPRAATSAGYRVAYYWCRLHSTKEWEPKDKGSLGNQPRKRNKPSRPAVACKMKFKAIFFQNGTVEIYRHGGCAEHNHTLEYSDQVKRNSAIRAIAGKEISSGAKISEVSHRLRAIDRPAVRQVLEAAGGGFLNLSEVHNVAAAWKKGTLRNSSLQQTQQAAPNEPGRRSIPSVESLLIAPEASSSSNTGSVPVPPTLHTSSAKSSSTATTKPPSPTSTSMNPLSAAKQALKATLRRSPP